MQSIHRRTPGGVRAFNASNVAAFRNGLKEANIMPHRDLGARVQRVSLKGARGLRVGGDSLLLWSRCVEFTAGCI